LLLEPATHSARGHRHGSESKEVRRVRQNGTKVPGQWRILKLVGAGQRSRPVIGVPTGFARRYAALARTHVRRTVHTTPPTTSPYTD
jgi:hypothetical protein